MTGTIENLALTVEIHGLLRRQMRDLALPGAACLRRRHRTGRQKQAGAGKPDHGSTHTDRRSKRSPTPAKPCTRFATSAGTS